jgi:hypothetical protein
MFFVAPLIKINFYFFLLKIYSCVEKKLGCLRLFNPSHPKNVYLLNMKVDDDRRLGRMILSHNAIQLTSKKNLCATTIDNNHGNEKTFFSIKENDQKDQEDQKDLDDGIQAASGTRWSVVSTDIIEERIEVILPQDKQNNGVDEKEKDEKKKKEKRNKKNQESPPPPTTTRTVTVITPITIEKLELPTEGILRITILMNSHFVQEALESSSESSSSSSDSDSDNDVNDNDVNEINDDTSSTNDTNVTNDTNEKNIINNISTIQLKRNKKQNTQQCLTEKFIWKDVKYMNLANTCWMGIGKKEKIIEMVETSTKDNKKTRRSSKRR